MEDMPSQTQWRYDSDHTLNATFVYPGIFWSIIKKSLTCFTSYTGNSLSIKKIVVKVPFNRFTDWNIVSALYNTTKPKVQQRLPLKLTWLHPGPVCLPEPARAPPGSPLTGWFGGAPPWPPPCARARLRPPRTPARPSSWCTTSRGASASPARRRPTPGTWWCWFWSSPWAL